jgi:zinc and cadmium transporter
MLSLIYALVAAFIVSLFSLLGVITLALKDEHLHKLIIYLVSFSAGGLIGGAFFHLLPESLSLVNNSLSVFVYLIGGFCFFFIIEKFLRWHHCHDEKCTSNKHLGILNLVGDSIHNFLDGVIIVTAFVASIGLGIVVTLSIIFHEIPQELGDFGVLLYAGFKKSTALLYNFLTALFALLGVLSGYFIIEWISSISIFLIPAAAGGFIYIATTDLVPELQKVLKTKHSILTFLVFILALVLMYGIKVLGG